MSIEGNSVTVVGDDGLSGEDCGVAFGSLLLPEDDLLPEQEDLLPEEEDCGIGFDL